MSMTADLRDRLKAAGIAGGAVYRDLRRQGDPLPGVVLLTVSDGRPSTYTGRQQMRETIVQVDCYGTSRGQADEIADAVIAAAEVAGVQGQTKFSRSFVDRQRNSATRPDDAGVTTFLNSLDLRVWHQPAI